METLSPVSEETLADSSEDYVALYERLVEDVGTEIAARYYNTGYAAFRTEDYDTAIENFLKSRQYNKEHVDTLYFLGMSYYRADKIDEARRTLDEVTTLFTGTGRAQQAANTLAEINNAND